MSKEAVLNELNSQVGSLIHQSEWIDISQEKIDAFADATEDHQWIHIYPTRAAEESPFKATIAHGYLTLSMTPAMTAQFVQFTNLERAINYGVNKVRFMNMVPVDSRVRARTEIIKVRQRAGAIQVTAQTTVEIENRDKPACVAETVSFYYLK